MLSSANVVVKANHGDSFLVNGRKTTLGTPLTFAGETIVSMAFDDGGFMGGDDWSIRFAGSIFAGDACSINATSLLAGVLFSNLIPETFAGVSKRAQRSVAEPLWSSASFRHRRCRRRERSRYPPRCFCPFCSRLPSLVRECSDGYEVGPGDESGVRRCRAQCHVSISIASWRLRSDSARSVIAVIVDSSTP